MTADYAGPGTAGSRAPDCEVVQLTDAVQDPNRGVTYLADDRGGTREGTALDDALLGGTGADTLRGRGGNDVLWGLRLAGVTSTQPDVAGRRCRETTPSTADRGRSASPAARATTSSRAASATT